MLPFFFKGNYFLRNLHNTLVVNLTCHVELFPKDLACDKFNQLYVLFQTLCSHNSLQLSVQLFRTETHNSFIIVTVLTLKGYRMETG